MYDATPLPQIPARRSDAHKGDFGRVLVLGGSRGLVGAAAMAGDAALRAGAGLAVIGCPRSVYPILAAKVTCPTTWPLPETEAESIADSAIGPVLDRISAEMDAVAIGPGLGRHESTRRFVRMVVERSPVPFVCDADAIIALSDDIHALARARSTGILTPHAGEMARFIGTSAADVQRHRDDVARAFAERWRHVLVLKGQGTLVAAGERVWRCPTGNPGMATGGTGDVLTGTILALLGRGFPPYEAARLGAWVHGRAGDIARDRLGETGLIATDVIEALPHAFKEIVAR